MSSDGTVFPFVVLNPDYNLQPRSCLYHFFFLFFLEHAGELRIIIILRRKEKRLEPIQYPCSHKTEQIVPTCQLPLNQHSSSFLLLLHPFCQCLDNLLTWNPISVNSFYLVSSGHTLTFQVWCFADFFRIQGHHPMSVALHQHSTYKSLD